jgi:hypothetical protein
MKGSVTSIKSAGKLRLRNDIIRWARRIGFTPQMSIENPDTIVDFIGRCIELYPDKFTHAHGSEIFAWCKESAPWRDWQPPTSGGPEAA